jgi:MYXO-CTERM domain-containing protein
MRSVSIVVASLLISGTAYAHIAMTVPAPRSSAQKAGPCGATGSTRGATVTELTAGETLVVEWDETVDHPGHYRIAFDEDGNDFTNPNHPGDNFPGTMVEPIVDNAGGHYTQPITVPMTNCENCTLQLVQVMTTSVPYNSFYFQCADIRIVGGSSSGGDDAGIGGGGDTTGGCSTGSSTGVGMLLLGIAFVARRRKSARAS